MNAETIQNQLLQEKELAAELFNGIVDPLILEHISISKYTDDKELCVNCSRRVEATVFNSIVNSLRLKGYDFAAISTLESKFRAATFVLVFKK